MDECDWDPCRYGGRCVNTNGSYYCECSEGYTGQNCENIVEHCAPSPCKNGGSCLNNQTGYECICMPGFSGNNCEVRLDTSCGLECENGGVCAENSNGPYCSCPSSYIGQNCEIAKPDPCAHDYCGSHGYCFALSDYNNYGCSCNEGYTGDHCQIKECTSELCVMWVSHCTADLITCNGHGRCIDVENDYRCICDRFYAGKNCELVDAQSSLLVGDVLLFLVGEQKHVMSRLTDILSAIDSVLRVSVRVHLDENNRPMIYAWDSEKGKGELLSNVEKYIDVNDETLFYKQGGLRNRRSIPKVEGALLYFQIDITPCHDAQRYDRNLTCPNSIKDVALELATSAVQQVLEPLGFSVYKADAREVSTGSKQKFILCVFFFGISPFVLLGMIGYGKWKKRRFAYREANFQSATIYHPPSLKEDQTTISSNASSMSSINLGGSYGPALVYPNRYILYPPPTTSIPARLQMATESLDNKNYHVESSATRLHRIVRDLEVCEDERYTMLYTAINNGHQNEVNAKDSMGCTPLHYAVQEYRTLKILQLLVANGANVDECDHDGHNPFHVAIQFINYNAAQWLLLNTKIDINAVARGRYTPLKLCALSGDAHISILKLLLEYRSDEIDLNAVGYCEHTQFHDGETALHLAASNNSTETIELLALAGADIDARNDENATPLIQAARYSQTDSLRTLLKLGANKDLVDAHGLKAIDFANQNKDHVGIQLLNQCNNRNVAREPSTRPKKRAPSNKTTKAGKKPRVEAQPSTSTSDQSNAAFSYQQSSVMLSPPSTDASPPRCFNFVPDGMTNCHYNHPHPLSSFSERAIHDAATAAARLLSLSMK
ncbi:hypothetical protein M3Y94_00748700 [Aphelenchoides besseyi]|nr:hypothetical protein M3Y94_00748700 [Aphelenchoides besseyi]